MSIWRNCRFEVDEVDARIRLALLRKMAGQDDAAQVVKLKDGGYMVQLNEKYWEAFNGHTMVSGKRKAQLPAQPPTHPQSG